MVRAATAQPPEARAAFVVVATDIVASLMAPGHDRDDIWVSIINVPDGGWGLGGRAYKGDGLVGALSAVSADAAIGCAAGRGQGPER